MGTLTEYKKIIVNKSFAFTYKEEPCNNQVHCTCENAVQEAAKCACSAHTHQEPGSYSWRNGELEIQSLCKLGNRKQPDFPSALGLEVQLSYIHPCICEARLPLPQSAASKPRSLQASSAFPVSSEKKSWSLYSKKKNWNKKILHHQIGVNANIVVFVHCIRKYYRSCLWSRDVCQRNLLSGIKKAHVSHARKQTQK